MSLDFKAATNIAQVLNQLDEIRKDQIPFATSRAMQRTTMEAREKVYASIPKHFDVPGRSFLKQGKAGRSGVRSGWIRADWPSKKQLVNKTRTTASVYIWGGPRDTAGAKSKGSNIDEIIHRNVFGDSANSVSLHTPNMVFGRNMIIEPTGILLTQPRKDKLIRLNKQGNIPALRKTMEKVKADRKNYLVLRIGQPNPNKKLTPGIYRKRYEPYIYKRGPRTSRGPLQRVVSLEKLLSFQTIRKYDKRWDFPKIVAESYSKDFDSIFAEEYANAVKSAKPKRKKFK